MNRLDLECLQRLVDGELTFDEIRAMALRAEADPELWRHIGSALIEDRLWRSEFAESLSQPESTCQSIAISKMESHRRPGWERLGWLALAASAVLTLTIALVNRSPDRLPIALPTLLDSQSSESKSDWVAVADPLSPDQNHEWKLNPAVYRMQLQDHLGNPYFDSDVPLYTADRSAALKWIQETGSRGISADIQQKASDSGVQLQQQIRYLSGTFSDGRSFVIPIRRLNVTAIQ